MKLLKGIKAFIYSVIYHTPKEKLNLEERESIRNNGLIHFCERKNINSIISEGVKGNLAKAMRKKEKGFTWFYIYDKSQFYNQLKIIHEKGERSKYDSYIIIKDLSNEQMDMLRIRRKVDNAVIYPESLKTKQMEGYHIKLNWEE